MPEQVVRARVRASGRVQGVWFRQSVADRARELGVAGWVRNLPDGAVEAILEGPPGAVESALAFVRVGPPRADVRACEVSWEAAAGEAGFSIRG